MAVDKRATRLGLLALVSVALFSLVGTRLWFLQGVDAQAYQARVSAAKVRTVYLPPERGRIFDTAGRVMADNKAILTVAVDWSVLRKPKNRNALFERLSGPLGISVAEMQQRYNPCYGDPKGDKCGKGQVYSTLLPLPLKQDVDEPTISYIKERAEDFPGVQIVEGWNRVYPFAPLASHVVGYMGGISEGNLQDYLAKGYNRNERVGQFGVEQSLEPVLHGKWGKQVFEVDAGGNIVREILRDHENPIAGEDVQLTIDLNMQQYAEQALETQLKDRRALPPDNTATYFGEIQPKNVEILDPITNKPRLLDIKRPAGPVPYKAPAGSVVVMNHNDGSVIAMASYPTFDNRWMEAGVSGTKYKQIFPSPDKNGLNPDGTKFDPDTSILVNRAVQGNYNLGSSIKPFVAWSAMHSGLITANSVWVDQGTYNLTSVDPSECQQNGGGAKCLFKNATCGNGKPCVYGPIVVQDALAVSSDTFFYRLGEQFYTQSRTLLKEDLSRFGFGSKTGVQLPFEWGGRVPDDAVKKNLVERGVLGKNEVPRLTVGDNVQVAIGQGLMAATPLQLTNAYATIANRGFLLQPQIVKAIYAPLTPDSPSPGIADLTAGTVITPFQFTVRDQLEMPSEVLDPIDRGLQRVVTPGQGVKSDIYHFTTGEKLFADYPASLLPVGGKTGTAQGAGTFPWNDSSAFAAFSLDDSKPFTVAAYLEKSGYGARGAAPIVKCIFTALAGKIVVDKVEPSDTLDLNSTVAAPAKQLADPSCLAGNDTTVGRG